MSSAVDEAVVNVEIDGVGCKARKGAMIIEVADEVGARVPRFCYHRKLSVAANCRMCLVEVEKAPKPLPACATPVMEGMKVLTRSPLALRAQKSVMEFLLINHPLDCPICDQGGECELQDVAMGYGRDLSRFTERKRVVADKDIGPLIATEMTRCIHCTRCVRFGEEIAGLPELGATGRGEHMEIGTFIERGLVSEMSGNMIDLCPVGALTSKPYRFRARSWEMQSHDGVSPHDGVGSNVHLHVSRSRVMRVVPRENEDINEVWISDRDRFGYEGLYSGDRLLKPAIKRGGEWRDVDWADALEYTSERLRRIVAEHGPAALGALVSPGATVEEAYLLQKVMRGLGCPNIDHRLRERDTSDQAHAPPFPSLGVSLAELEQRDAVLLVGAYPRKEQPIVNHRLRKASLRGAAIMVLNPVDFEFNLPIAQRCIVSPAGMVEALAAVVLALAPGESGPEREIAAVVGEVEIGEPARRIAEVLERSERPSVLLGPGVVAHPEGALLRALATRAALAAGASLGLLVEGANGAGAWIAGAVPHRDSAARPIEPAGRDARAMLEDRLRGYVVYGIEPELDCGDSATARSALEEADLVVACSGFRSAAMDAYADVLLPVAAFAETPGTFVNLEGTWQTFTAAVSPPGEARPGWKVLRVLGNSLALPGFEHVEATDVLDEAREQAGSAAAAAPRWPLEGSGRARLEPSEVVRVGNVPIYAADPLVRRAKALQASADGEFEGMRLGPALAARLDVSTGDVARVRQGGGEVAARVIVDPAVPDGCVQLCAGMAETVGLGPDYGAVALEKA